MRNISARAVSQTTNGRLIPRDQFPEGIIIAIPDLGYQRCILRCCDIRHNIQFHTRLTSGLKLEIVTENLRNNDEASIPFARAIERAGKNFRWQSIGFCITSLEFV